MADDNKIVVEVTKNDAPVVIPTFSWWICYRDKKDDKFVALTANELEDAMDLVNRLGKEVAGREIFLSSLQGAYVSEVELRKLADGK